VKAGGIVKFTGYLAGALVLIALVITKIRSTDSVIGGMEGAPTQTESTETGTGTGTTTGTDTGTTVPEGNC
jgi:hypothetical protein